MKKIKVYIKALVADSLFPAIPLLLLLAITTMLLRKQYSDPDKMQAEEIKTIEAAMKIASQYPEPLAILFRIDLAGYMHNRTAYFTNKESDKLQDSAGLIAGMLWKRVAELSRNEGNRVTSAQMMTAMNKIIAAPAMQATGKIRVATEVFTWLLFAGMLIIVIYRHSIKHRKKSSVLLSRTMVSGKLLKNIPHTYKKRYRV